VTSEGRRHRPADERCAIRSGSARCCSASRWRTWGRRRRRICWPSSSGCSPSRAGSSAAIADASRAPLASDARTARRPSTRPRRWSGSGPGRTRTLPTTDPPVPELSALPAAPRTRFAPAPTGFLHLGHVANALWIWGVAARIGGRVLLRIEDHDRQRSRRAFDAAILEDLTWLGFVPDAGPVRQTDPDAEAAYESAIARLTVDGHVYRCACTRATFAAWARVHGRDWGGPGCPGACRTLALPGDAATSLRVALGPGIETFDDLLLGRQRGAPSATGDLVVRDRSGNWTYAFAVVVDDVRHGIDLVIRGSDLLTDTARQIRLGRLIGRDEPPRFIHHPLVRHVSGRKLSKSDRDTGVRDLRAAGWSPDAVRAEAARQGDVPAAVVARDSVRSSISHA
jgi:glutamyl/glutaminyl-tRNA synthetase